MAPTSGLPSFLDNQHTIETKADADAYIARLEAFATLLDQEADVARHDMAMKVAPPDFALTKTLTQIQALRAPAPDKSSLTTSVVRRTEDKKIPGDYAQLATRVVKDKSLPGAGAADRRGKRHAENGEPRRRCVATA